MFEIIRRALYLVNGVSFVALYAAPAGEQRAFAGSALVIGLFVQAVFRAEKSGQLIQ
jgi:hypothetical protein